MQGAALIGTLDLLSLIGHLVALLRYHLLLGLGLALYVAQAVLGATISHQVTQLANIHAC